MMMPSRDAEENLVTTLHPGIQRYRGQPCYFLHPGIQRYRGQPCYYFTSRYTEK